MTLSGEKPNWVNLFDRLNQVDKVLEAVQIEHKVIQAEAAALAKSILAELDHRGLLAEGRETEAETILRGGAKERGAR